MRRASAPRSPIVTRYDFTPGGASRTAEPHPPGLRHPHLADTAGQAAHLARLERDDPEPLPSPAGLAMVPQHCLLGGRRDQTVPGHANTLANATDIPEEVKRRFLPGLKSGVSTPRS